MATNIRPGITPNSPYWISKHRYYELKHFCMQYPEWRKRYFELDGYFSSPDMTDDITTRSYDVSDPTYKHAEERHRLYSRFKMLDDVAGETDEEIGYIILRAVIAGCSYDAMNTRKPMPCSKEHYYELYRKFFWLLSKARDEQLL